VPVIDCKAAQRKHLIEEYLRERALLQVGVAVRYQMPLPVDRWCGSGPYWFSTTDRLCGGARVYLKVG
jgi:hypothetical protein